MEVPDLFNHLFISESLALVTIEGYTSVIDSVWEPSVVYTSAGNECIIQLITNFKRERLRPVNTMPKWDLSVVLRYFRHPKFHFLESMTTSLAFLALASRCQEVRAIDLK